MQHVCHKMYIYTQLFTNLSVAMYRPMHMQMELKFETLYTLKMRYVCISILRKCSRIGMG